MEPSHRSLVWRLAAVVLFLTLLVGCTKSRGADQVEPPPQETEQQQQEQEQQQPQQQNDKEEETSPLPPPVTEDAAVRQLKQLSLEEKIGQMVIIGVDGTELSAETKSLLTDLHAGGIILYKPNIESVEQTARLVGQLKQANAGNKIPLLISIDQEGGAVNRLPAAITATPSSRTIAKNGKPERAGQVGEAIGSTLTAFGMNVNFAPVLDIDSNPKNPVIGDRSFGSSADIVSSYGIAMMKGLQQQHVAPVVKHFPGHGDTSVDSHLDLPVVDKSLEQLQKLELQPFAKAIADGADAVMIAHILLPKLDPDYPATLSRAVVHDLLRTEMGFDGVVITDDMTMGAILKHHKLGEAAVRSVQAGVDLVLVAHEYSQAKLVLQALKQAVEQGTLTEADIDAHVLRILKWKERYEMNDNVPDAVDPQQLNARIREALQPAS